MIAEDFVNSLGLTGVDSHDEVIMQNHELADATELGPSHTYHLKPIVTESHMSAAGAAPQ